MESLYETVLERTEDFFKKEFKPVLSEGQLQFNLAKYLEGDFNRVYVECPIYKEGVRRSADIVIFRDDDFMLLELKYKTAEWTDDNGELKLVKQSGQTQGVNGFYDDIDKIRQCDNDSLNGIFDKSRNKYKGGLAIFCTNDSYYHEWRGEAWKGKPRSPDMSVWKESCEGFKYCIANNDNYCLFFEC